MLFEYLDLLAFPFALTERRENILIYFYQRFGEKINLLSPILAFVDFETTWPIGWYLVFKIS